MAGIASAATGRRSTQPWAPGSDATRVPPADTTIDADFPAVLVAAGKGEHWALTKLFRAYQPHLLRYLRNQEPSFADDLAGDVWVAVARGLKSFTGDETNFRGWLFTIGKYRVIEHRRKAARRRTDPIADDRLDGLAEHGLGRDPAGLVLEQIGAQDAIDRLTTDLSPDQAEALRLRVLGGLDVNEVARIMDRTPGSVRVLCHRALRRLADRYGEEVMAE
jgi:RNA polymerase sigma-70 factor (ECF subfamily)